MKNSQLSVGLCQHWITEHHRFAKVSAILLATAATLVACGALAYVQFVRPIAAFDYRGRGLGFAAFVFRHHLGIGHPSLPALVFFTGARRLGMDACAVFSGWFHILKAQHGVEPRIGETSMTLIEGVLSTMAWLRKLSRLLAQPGSSVVDYFRFARQPPKIVDDGLKPDW